MPTVPTYNEPQVREQATPNVQLNINAPREAFGGGRASEPVFDEATKIFAEQKQNADQVAVTDFNAKVTKLRNDLIYNPQTGLMNRKGKDAFGAPEEYMERFQQGVQSLQEGLTGQAQLSAAAKLAQQHGTELDSDIQKHVFTEARNFDDETTNTGLAAAQDDATLNYHDPGKVVGSIETQKQLIQEWGRRNGASEEAIKLKTEEMVSKTHLGVVDRMLANQEDTKAKAYFETFKDQISGKDSTILEKAIEEGTSRGESQRQSDLIVASTTSRMDALNKARNIEDPKIRDLTEDRINKFFTERKQAEAEAKNDLYLSATNLIDRNPGRNVRDVVPASVWSQLTLEHRVALERRAAAPDSNDSKRWLDFLEKSPAQLASMSRADFEAGYWAHFDEAHRNRAESQWNTARDAAEKKADDPKLASTLSFKERLDNTIRTTGLVPMDRPRSKFSNDQAKTYAQFEQAAAKEIENFEMNQLGGKRHATGEEQQKIIDDMAIKRVFIKNSGLFSDREKPAAILNQDEKGKAYVPIEKVPSSDRSYIEGAMRANGKKYTKSDVERAYAAYLIGDRQLFKSLMAGQ